MSKQSTEIHFPFVKNDQSIHFEINHQSMLLEVQLAFHKEQMCACGQLEV